jgi:hypothetical protein
VHGLFRSRFPPLARPAQPRGRGAGACFGTSTAFRAEGFSYQLRASAASRWRFGLFAVWAIPTFACGLCNQHPSGEMSPGQRKILYRISIAMRGSLLFSGDSFSHSNASGCRVGNEWGDHRSSLSISGSLIRTRVSSVPVRMVCSWTTYFPASRRSNQASPSMLRGIGSSGFLA